jgi:uncharacterized protein (TIGR04255 family)
MPTSEREIYSNPPLEVVAWELRIPHSLRLAEKAVQIEVWERLRERLPLTQPQQALEVGLGAPMVQAQQPLRMLDRGRTHSVVIGAEVVVVENTSYRCFEDFCELLREVLSALPSREIAGFTRVGLRYVNEIRLEGVTTVSDWEGLVSGSLIAATSLASEAASLRRLTGEAEFATGPEHSVLMRYGVIAGRVVNIEGPLRTRTSESAPAFLIDLDSYWESPSGQELPSFEIDAVIDATSELRDPIHHLFEAVITERLRQSFREEHA